MDTFEALSTGFRKGKELAAGTAAGQYRVAEQHVFDYGKKSDNLLACGDNLSYLAYLLESGYAGRIKCVYLDPPFFTKAKYNAVIDLQDADGHHHKIRHLAFNDLFERDLEHYVENMTARLLLIRELMAEDGLIWMHLDWHSSHYMRIIMDEVFGSKNFINEIVWKYKSGGSGKRHFSRKHDAILLYSRSSAYRIRIPQEKSYNRGLKPYHFKGVKEYKDDYGWYTMVNMKDVWSIDMVGRTSGERTGYATQKPVELLKRIILASTDPGDLCADFFCGSGSFLYACETLGRSWIGCDSEALAVTTTKKRLDAARANYMACLPAGEPVSRPGLEMRMTACDELENGKKLCRFAVGSFRPDIDFGYIPLKDRPVVEKILAQDPLRFIDYIMVDPYSNDPFSCEMIVEDSFDDILFITRGDASFIAVDVFGKAYYYKSSE